MTSERVISKVVLSGANGTFRKVFYNRETGLQIAVASRHDLQRENPLLTEWSDIRLSIPIEGMNGWAIDCKSWTEVERIVERECSFRGKVLNRLWTLPRSFFSDKLY